MPELSELLARLKATNAPPEDIARVQRALAAERELRSAAVPSGLAKNSEMSVAKAREENRAQAGLDDAEWVAQARAKLAETDTEGRNFDNGIPDDEGDDADDTSDPFADLDRDPDLDDEDLEERDDVTLSRLAVKHLKKANEAEAKGDTKTQIAHLKAALGHKHDAASAALIVLRSASRQA
jgi:hypothetical protein